MKITMLGTGNALVTECYNTCFVMEDNGEKLLVDAGGGNQVFTQLKKAGINWMDLHHIIITHKHVDHIMGIIWMVRMIGQYMNAGKYQGDAYIYGHEEVIGLVDQISRLLVAKKSTKFLGDRIHLVTVTDGESLTLIGNDTTFFDIHSTKAKQFGFSMRYDGGKKLTCLGDESYQEVEAPYVQDADILMHEAFCLYSEADEFHPYEKDHSTVKDACELAERMHVRSLILYHTEDKNILRRKELYTAEGKAYFHGTLLIPDDLEAMEF